MLGASSGRKGVIFRIIDLLSTYGFGMAKVAAITKTTVFHAVREAEAGRKFERRDHEVGLALRCQGRSVRWSVKLTLLGSERRWDLGDATLHEPEWYRALAREVRALCKVGVNPGGGSPA